MTTLHEAAVSDDPYIEETIKLLLENGANVDKKNFEGRCAFQNYIVKMLSKGVPGKSTLLKLLLPSEQQDIDQRCGISPLHEASIFHRSNCVRELAYNGAEINAKDSAGLTPLHYAMVIAHGDKELISTIRLLLDFGADVTETVVLHSGPKCNAFEMAHNLDYRVQNKRRIINTLVEHAVKLTELDSDAQYQKILTLCMKRMYWPPRIADHIKKYRSECAKEVTAMKLRTVGKSTISFFDILSADSKKKLFNAKNNELIKAFLIDKENFHIYTGMLEVNFNKILRRQKLIDNAAVTLSDALQFADFADAFFEKTLAYCSNNDLLRLVDSS